MHYTAKPAEAEWHTIFSGNKKWTCWNSSTDGSTKKTVWITGLPNNVQNFRATGSGFLENSNSTTLGTVTFYLADGTQGFYKQQPDKNHDISYTFTDQEFMRIYQYGGMYGGGRGTAIITYDAATGTLNVSQSGNSTYCGYITITKIEALY